MSSGIDWLVIKTTERKKREMIIEEEKSKRGEEFNGKFK